MEKMMNHPMMKKCCNKDFGLLLLRIGVGLVFVLHGYGKFQDMASTIGFFSTLGLGAFVAYAVTVIEILGGLAVLLGVFFCVANMLLALVMVFAIILVKWGMVVKMGLPNSILVMEIDIILLVSTLALSMLGAGKYALMSKKCHCCDKCNDTCIDGSCCAGCKDMQKCCMGMCSGSCGKWKKGTDMKCDSCDGCKDNCTQHEAK